MRLFRRVAHLLLGWMFLQSGIDVIRKPEGRADIAGETIDRLRQTLPVVPDDDVAVVRANAAIHVVAGALLAMNRLPRLSALVLAGSLVSTTIGGHPFWTIDDPARRAQQRTHFYKNLAILGGLLSVATEPGPRRSS